jgi:gliding motility-associated-like protein
MQGLIRHIVLFLLIFPGYETYAQTNLVPNGDFETYSVCPTQLSNTTQQLTLATGWVVPTSGTPDYFNSCAGPASNVAVPLNTYGYQTPHSGNAYAGFYAYMNPVQPLDNVREYLQITLSQSLTAGKTYYFKMHLNLANSLLFRKSVSNIGAYFSTSAINKLDNAPFTLIPQVQSGAFITDTLNWTEVAGSFIASGGERYLTIGRFGTENTISAQSLSGDASTTNSSYYYIDDVSLIDSCYKFNSLNSILGSDASYNCVEKPINVTLNVQNAITSNYNWSTGETSPTLTVMNAGTYWVKMSSGKCFAIDTVKIQAKTKPVFSLGNDTAACFNSTLILKPAIFSDSSLSYTYRWVKRVGATNFELGSNTSFSINYPDEIILELTANGCKNQDTIVIHATSMQRVNLPSDTTICRNTSLLLNAQTTGALYYHWSSGETTPGIRTHNELLYRVVVRDSFCLSSDSVHYTIKGPVSYLRDTLICGQQTITLKGDPLSTGYFWSTGATGDQAQIQSGGTYFVVQQKDGCTVADTAHIIMDPVPYADLGSDTLMCVDPVYELKANSPLAISYLWDSGDTTSSIVLQKSGKYAVTTRNKNCTFRDSVLIQTQINTPFSFGDDQYDCFSEPIILNPKAKGSDKLLWSDGSTGKSYKVTKPGTYWLKVTSGVCINSDTITFYPKVVPTVDLGHDTVLCIGNKLMLDAQDSTGYTYIWSTGADSRKIEVAQTGYYFVEKRTFEGCYASDTIDVKFIKGFELIKKRNWNVCEDSSTVIIPNQNLASYLWNDQSTLPTLTVRGAGDYWLKGTDTNGCVVQDTVHIDQYAIPDPALDSVIYTCEFPITIKPEGHFKSYLWTGGSTGSTKEITAYGWVTLAVTDSIGCKAKGSIEVKNNCPPGVTMTNAFTPNDDGLNDQIIPQYEHIKSTHYQITNRWGGVVFETSDIEKAWDGLLQNGEKAGAGVYYYLIECKGLADETFKLHGTITLIR